MAQDLFLTRMGQKFYEVTAPRIADELARLNSHLAELIAVLRASGQALPTAPQPSKDDAASDE